MFESTRASATPRLLAAVRLIAGHLKQHFSQTFIVESREGAGATLGARISARAAPDGTTLLVADWIDQPSPQPAE